MKQVVAICGECGGPGITTEGELASSGGKMIHADPAVCANVRRNTGRHEKKASHVPPLE